MAFAHIGNFISAQDKTAAQSSTTVTTNAALEAGNLGLISVAIDNTDTTDTDLTSLGSALVTGITVGGVACTFLRESTQASGVALDGVTVSRWYIIAPSLIASGSNVVVSYAATTPTAKVFGGEEYTIDAGTTSLAVDGATVAVGTGDPASMSATGVQNVEHLWTRTIGGERTSAVALTPTATWTATTGNTTSGGANDSNITLRGEFLIATGTGSGATDPTWATADNVNVLLGLIEVAGGGGGFTKRRRLGTSSRRNRSLAA